MYFFFVSKEDRHQMGMCAWEETNNPTSDEILKMASKKPHFAKEVNIDTILFRDEYISVMIPKNEHPITLFPQLKFINNTITNYSGPVLSILPLGSKWAANVTVSFQDKARYFPAIDMHFESEKELLNGTIGNLLLKTLENKTWEDKMIETAKALGLPKENISFVWNNGSHDTVLLPSMKPIDIVKTLFSSDFSLYKPKGRLEYQILFPNEPFLTLGNEYIFNKLANQKLTSMVSFINTLLKVFDEYVANDFNNEEKVQAGIKASIICSIRILTNFSSHLGSPRFDFTNWPDFVSYFVSLGDKDSLMRSNKSNQDRGDFIQKMSKVTVSHASFLCSSKTVMEQIFNLHTEIRSRMAIVPEPDSCNLFGNIIFACVAEIESSPYALIVTRGFLMVQNFSPEVTDRHQMFPHNYKFTCSNASPQLFATPLSHCVVCPIPPQTVVIATRKGVIAAKMPTIEAYEAFFVSVTVCRRLLNGPIVPSLPRPQSLQVDLTMSTAGAESNVTISTRFLGKKCEMSRSIAEFKESIEKVLESSKVFSFPNTHCTSVPAHIASNARFAVFGVGMTAAEIAADAAAEMPPESAFEVDWTRALLADALLTNHRPAAFEALQLVGASIEAAFESGDPEAIDVLFDAFEAEIAKDDILSYASKYTDNMEVTRALLDNLERCGFHGQAAVLDTVRRSSPAQMQVLVDAGLSCSAEAGDGLTPLVMSIANETAQTTAALLRNGAGVNVNIGAGKRPTALRVALETGKPIGDLAQYLGETANFPSADGLSVLHTSVGMGRVDAILELARQSPTFDPNISSPSFPHILHYFLELGEERRSNEVLDALLSIPNLDVEPYDTNGMTPLARAVDCKKPPLPFIERLLADRRTRVDLPCQDGQTPLIIAARSGYSNVVMLLLTAGANVDMPAPNGATAAFAAAIGGHVETLDVLLEHGANLDLWGQDPKLVEGLSPTVKATLQNKGFALLMADDVNGKLSFMEE